MVLFKKEAADFNINIVNTINFKSSSIRLNAKLLGNIEADNANGILKSCGYSLCH